MSEEEDYGMDEEEYLQDFDWLEPMDGQITLASTSDSDITKVGYVYGELIRRRRFGDFFYNEMEKPTDATASLAFDLFDRYGRLREEFKTHAMKKGPGVWGDELDTGDLLLLEKVVINKSYRRQGLSQKLINAIIDITRPKCGQFFVIVLVGSLIRTIDDEFPGMTEEEKGPIYQWYEDAARHFYRSLGFRRIGSTNWFALAGDKNHASHDLLALDDYDPPERPNTYFCHR